jgi:ADP-heptose:LPS heptosyltransferase
MLLDEKLKVLFVRFSAYGDVIMCLPALAHYATQRPEDEIHLLISPRFADIVRYLPGIAQVHHYLPQRNLGGVGDYVRCAMDLAAERFDVVFDWQANPRSRLLVATLLARQVYSFDRRVRRHQLDKCVNTLLAAGLEPPGAIIPLPLYGPEEKEWAEQTIAGLPKADTYVALGVGGFWETKLWPEENFARLIDLLNVRGKFHFVILGGSDERELQRSERLAAARPEFATDLCGQTTINQAAALVRACDLTISHDTSIMHLAWAQGRPVIGIFGATGPVRTGPLGADSYAFAALELHCHPCFRGRCRLPRMECLLRITPKDVARRAHKLLDQLSVEREAALSAFER